MALELSTTMDSDNITSDVDGITEEIAFLLFINDEQGQNNNGEIATMDQAQTNIGTKGTAMLANEIERWAMLFVVLGYSLFALVVNGFTIGVIRTQHRLQKPEYTVMVMFAVVNIGINVPFHFLQILPRLILLDELLFEDYPLMACRAFSVIGIIFIYMSLCSPAILGVMRYVQICYPLYYIAHVTDYTVYALFGTAFAISAIYTVGAEVVIGRQPAVHSLVCQLPHTRVNILMQTTLFVLIPMLILVFCTLRIYCLEQKMRDARASRRISQHASLNIG